MQWSKLVKVWGPRNEIRSIPHVNIPLPLRTATAPRKRKLQPDKLRLGPDGVREGLWGDRR